MFRPLWGHSWDLAELGDITSQDGGEREAREGRVKGSAAGEGGLQTAQPSTGRPGPFHSFADQLHPAVSLPTSVPLGLGGKGSPACSLHTARGEQRLQPTPPRQLLSVRQEHRSAGSWQRCPSPGPAPNMCRRGPLRRKGVCKGFGRYREGTAPKNTSSAHMSLCLQFHH